MTPRSAFHEDPQAGFLAVNSQQDELLSDKPSRRFMSTQGSPRSHQQSFLNEVAATPEQIKRKHKIEDQRLKLQATIFKKWFRTRAMKNAHTHYYRTGAEVQADNIIDDMFQKLDADGGGTLDVGEITALFKENGIHMSED